MSLEGINAPLLPAEMHDRSGSTYFLLGGVASGGGKLFTKE